MGVKLFGLDIARILNDSIKGAGGLPKLKLIEKSSGDRTVGSLTAGQTIAEKAHACTGFVDEWTVRERAEMNIEQGARKVVIIGASLPASVEPQVDDFVVVDATGDRYRVARWFADPAKATWTGEALG